MSNQRSRHNPDSLTSKPKLYITGFSDSLPRYLITSHSSWAIMQTDKSPFRTASQILKKSSRNFSPLHQFQQPPLTLLRNSLQHHRLDLDAVAALRLVTTLKIVAPKTPSLSRNECPTTGKPGSQRAHPPSSLLSIPLFMDQVIFSAILCSNILHLRLKPSRLSLRTQKS